MPNSLVSIVVNNYNYARFVAEAIDSALSQTWQPVEVIVVDDGSTDNSAEVIRGYGDRVQPVFKPNGGQASAVNEGLPLCRGQIVIFLDADDVLLPHAAERVAAVFAARPGTAKVQYRMRVIDGQGQPTGELRPAPRLPLHSGDLRRQEVSFPFDLPWAAMSANAFSADVLRRIVPLPLERYRRAGTDWYLAHVAALFGEVGALDEVCGLYRLHGSNQYGREDALNLDKISLGVRCANAASADLARYADQLGLAHPDPILSVSQMAGELTLLKLAGPQPDYPGGAWHVARQGLQAAARRFDVRWTVKTLFMVWFLAVAAAPRPLARALATGFFVPEQRRGLNVWLGRQHRGTTP